MIKFICNFYRAFIEHKNYIFNGVNGNPGMNTNYNYKLILAEYSDVNYICFEYSCTMEFKLLTCITCNHIHKVQQYFLEIEFS